MSKAHGFALFAGLWVSSTAHATDTWREVTTGIDHLHRTTGGDVPQDIHVVRVDLTRENISIQASSSEIGTERAVTTRTFADHIGATVAINADWISGATSIPRGLAIANGALWNEHYDDPGIGSVSGYFACDAFNDCEAVALEPLGTAWWFASPAPLLQPHRYFNAVGANGVMLIDNGVRHSGCHDGPGCEGDACRHPRTAICTTADKSELYMMAIDGRRSGASGMRCSEVRDLAEEFGCWDAAMLDGGGSTTMVIEGSVENEPSDGYERVLPNHIAVVATPSLDERCAITSGRWCEGTEMTTCSGGRYITEGDCAYFGATCEEDGDWAYCVDFRCPDGEGDGTTCSGEGVVEACNDGRYTSGDCSFFGSICASDSTGARCSDPRCEAGPNSSFCVTPSLVGGCSDGVYSETACDSDHTCEASGELAVCMAPVVEPVDGDDDTSVWPPIEEPIDTAAPIPEEAADTGEASWGGGLADSGDSGEAPALPPLDADDSVEDTGLSSEDEYVSDTAESPGGGVSVDSGLFLDVEEGSDTAEDTAPETDGLVEGDDDGFGDSGETGSSDTVPPVPEEESVDTGVSIGDGGATEPIEAADTSEAEDTSEPEDTGLEEPVEVEETDSPASDDTGTPSSGDETGGGSEEELVDTGPTTPDGGSVDTGEPVADGFPDVGDSDEESGETDGDDGVSSDEGTANDAEEEVVLDTGDGAGSDKTGCSCASSASPVSRLGWILSLLGVVTLRRRRRTESV